MWTIFLQQNLTNEECLLKIEDLKLDIFKSLEFQLKTYFAEKITVYFDNNMLFSQKSGIQMNLIDALMQADEDAINLKGVFPKVELYWVRDDKSHNLVFSNLKDKYITLIINKGFSLVKKNTSILTSLEELEFNSLKSLIFDVELVNYVTNWIKYAPSLERRCELQTEHILINTHLKNKELSLLESMELEKNLKNSSSYNNLYTKIYRVMPKIINNLEQEWQNKSQEITKEIKLRRKKI